MHVGRPDKFENTDTESEKYLDLISLRHSKTVWIIPDYITFFGGGAYLAKSCRN